MMPRKMTAEQFLKDVYLHEMTVLKDDGLYRHLRFSQQESWTMWFEIVTWPGALIIRGDMGSWVFSHVEDMFPFFRRPELTINEIYWMEKCIAQDTSLPSTYRRLWCLHAIVWGIQQYDAREARDA